MSELMTVTGPVRPEDLGIILPHEHIMSRFGADACRYPDYPVEPLLAQVLPYLSKVKALGVTAIADCTTAFFGRHPELLKRISEISGVKILTNTGYYSARKARYVPAHAFEETPEQIAARWIHEWDDSIDETGIRPGLIKISVEADPLTDIERRLIDAAILTHQRTGLVIETHTGDYPAAAEYILDRLDHQGTPVEAWVWVHAHAVETVDPLLRAAARGAWISLDGVAPEREERILASLNALKAAGYLDRVVLSHDGDSFTVDGSLRPYDDLLTGFVPRLRQAGYSQAEIDRLTIENPARMLSVRSR